MNDDDLKRAYAASLAAGRPASRQACPSPEALLALVERRGSELERLATLDHAMACEACRRDLELLRAIESAGAPSGAGRFGFSAPVRAAAAVVLMIVGGAAAALLLRREPSDTPMRGGASIGLVAPTGEVRLEDARTFTWRQVPGARGYDVEVLTAAGDSVFSGRATDTDTTLRLPDAAPFAPGREYVWSVRASMPDGTHAAAVPRRFRVRP